MALLFDFTFEHILQHQDDTVIRIYTGMSQLNVDYDLVAKAILISLHHIRQRQQDTLLHEVITIRINGSKIVGDVGVPLCDEI